MRKLTNHKKKIKGRYRFFQLSFRFGQRRSVRRHNASSYENRCPNCGAQGFVNACRHRCSFCGYTASCED